MGTLRKWLFDLANGTTLTGGGGGNVKDSTGTLTASQVTNGAGSAATSSTDHPYPGATSAKFAAASGANSIARLPLDTTSASLAASVGFWYSGTAPTVIVNLWNGRATGGINCQLKISTAGKVQLQNSAGTTLFTATAALTVGFWRVDMYFTEATTTTGSGQIQYASGDSATPVETSSAITGVNFGNATPFAAADVGRIDTGAIAFTAYITSVQMEEGRTSFIGPLITTSSGTATETVTVAETAAGVTVTAGTASETVTVPESAAAVTVTISTGTSSEPVTVGESAAALTVTAGTATETVTTAESAAGVTVTIGTAAETVTVAESTTATTVTLGTATETITVAESTVSSTVAGGSATGSESITLAESAAGLTISTGTVTETVTVTESAAGQTTTLGTAIEPITVTETAAALTVTIGTAYEPVTLLETADAVTVFLVTLAETITLAESIAIAHDLDLTISIGTPRSTAGMFVGAPQISADVVGSPRTTTPVTIGRGV